MSSENDLLVELPPEVMNTIAEVMPDVSVNLPLKDETEKPFFPQNFFNIPQNFYSIPQNFFNIPQNFYIKNVCLKMIIGLIILLMLTPNIMSTFYGYFLIMFIFVVVLRNTK